MLIHDTALTQDQRMDSGTEVFKVELPPTPSPITNIEIDLVGGAPEVINNPE